MGSVFTTGRAVSDPQRKNDCGSQCFTLLISSLQEKEPDSRGKEKMGWDCVHLRSQMFRNNNNNNNLTDQESLEWMSMRETNRGPSELFLRKS